jgi:hypothetical protein
MDLNVKAEDAGIPLCALSEVVGCCFVCVVLGTL